MGPSQDPMIPTTGLRLHTDFLTNQWPLPTYSRYTVASCASIPARVTPFKYPLLTVYQTEHPQPSKLASTPPPLGACSGVSHSHLVVLSIYFLQFSWLGLPVCMTTCHSHSKCSEGRMKIDGSWTAMWSV